MSCAFDQVILASLQMLMFSVCMVVFECTECEYLSKQEKKERKKWIHTLRFLACISHILYPIKLFSFQTPSLVATFVSGDIGN